MSAPVFNPGLVAPVGAPPPTTPGGAAVAPTGPAFREVIAQRTGGVQFSNHALQRLERRGIDVSPQSLARLDQGVARAAAKGGRESVVLVDSTAFVVSVRNRTVITAVDQAQMRDQVFTNIDSAVIA